jgi:hypothetical protein
MLLVSGCAMSLGRMYGDNNRRAGHQSKRSRCRSRIGADLDRTVEDQREWPGGVAAGRRESLA